MAHNFQRLVGLNDAGSAPSGVGLKVMRDIAQRFASTYPKARFAIVLGNNDDPCGDYRSEAEGAYNASVARVLEPLVNRHGASPGFIADFTRGAYYTASLPNGMRIWTVHHPQVPLVAFTLLVRRGAASDPAGKDGLAAFTADMLDEGSGTRSAIEMHEALAKLGAQFDTDIGSDATVASVTVLSRFADRALAILSDIVARPAMREAPPS